MRLLLFTALAACKVDITDAPDDIIAWHARALATKPLSRSPVAPCVNVRLLEPKLEPGGRTTILYVNPNSVSSDEHCPPVHDYEILKSSKLHLEAEVFGAQTRTTLSIAFNDQEPLTEHVGMCLTIGALSINFDGY